MELRDFAEQVLFATTLEDKLRRPEVLTDDRPGPARPTPDQPGRPAELRFKPTGAQRDFPGLHRLEQEQERGRLLHFFANHELLATELMALVLLRFPDAPAAFRRGVAQTLQEEQDHTRLYLRRMQQCGLQFGELPVSGYFWRTVSPMQHPMDFVAGLSLTFEQANLDFCRQFARGFAAVGDTTTSELLEGIYRDEIAHVAHGLKWFRRWKDPGLSDWDAFSGHLKFPLSPQRAKGTWLNVEGRRAAGLDAQFIAELDIFSQSKGRTPQVFVFNPFAEGRLARGSSFAPVKAQVQLAQDLAHLPLFLGRQDDVVLVPRRPAAPFLSRLKQAGFPLPEFVELEPDPQAALRSLAQRKLGGLRPWAWAPDSRELLEPLFASVTGESRPPEEYFPSEGREWYAKAASAEFLREVLEAERATPGLCPPEVVGRTVGSLAEAREVIADLRSRGFVRLVAKESIGLAGRNALRLWEPTLLPNQERWLAANLERGISVVLEPWLDRLVDFSLQGEVSSDGFQFLGFTGLLNDHRGQYQGNWVEPQPRRVPTPVTHPFPSRIASEFPAFFQRLSARLGNWLRARSFRGPVGIDAFVYRDPAGDARLKPVVEINPRYTMGRVALELLRHVQPGGHVRFRLVNRSQLESLGHATFAEYAHALATQLPPRWAGEPRARLQEGAVCLSDPDSAQVCLAVLEVQRRPFEFTIPGGSRPTANEPE